MAIRRFSRTGGYSAPIEKGFRSGLEETIAKQLNDAGIPVVFEEYSISYVIPASDHIYTPDFVLDNGIIIEGKGLFESDDRKKHLLIKAQYPHLDIRFVFSNPSQKLYKGAKSTYADWCDKYGFKYAKKFIPNDWLKEKSKKNTAGLTAKKGKK